MEGKQAKAQASAAVDDIINLQTRDPKEIQEASSPYNRSPARAQDSSEEEDEMQEIRRLWQERMFKEGVPKDFKDWKFYMDKKMKEQKEMWTL